MRKKNILTKILSILLVSFLFVEIIPPIKVSAETVTFHWVPGDTSYDEDVRKVTTLSRDGITFVICSQLPVGSLEKAEVINQTIEDLITSNSTAQGQLLDELMYYINAYTDPSSDIKIPAANKSDIYYVLLTIGEEREIDVELPGGDWVYRATYCDEAPYNAAGIVFDSTASYFELEASRSIGCINFSTTNGLGETKEHTISGDFVVTTEATCTTKGVKTKTGTCSECGKENATVTEEIDLIDHITELQNMKDATTSEEGYTGDHVCTMCHEIITAGEVIPKLVPVCGENQELSSDGTSCVCKEGYREEVTGCVEDITEEEPVVEPEPESVIEEPIVEEEPEIEVYIDLTELENRSEPAAKEAQNKIDNTIDKLKSELKSGQISEVEFYNQVESVRTIANVATQIEISRQETKKELETIKKALPEGTDIEKLIDDFYKTQFELVLNNDAKILDLSISRDIYLSALDFIEDAVAKIIDASLLIKECSKQRLTTIVEDYIEKVVSKTFKDFNKQKADEEFVEAAYQAILVNMQSQVQKALSENYEKAKFSNSYIGTAATQLEANYKAEMESVSDLETFEIMVLEVLRMKYTSLLNNQLESNLISQSEYNKLFKNAEDVEDFEPIYKEIFKSWALNTNNQYNISLEDITATTITNTVKASIPSGYVNTSGFGYLSKKEEMFLVCFLVAAIISVIAYYSADFYSAKNRRRRRRLAYAKRVLQ